MAETTVSAAGLAGIDGDGAGPSPRWLAAVPHRADAPLVGRTRELADGLRAALERSEASRRSGTGASPV